MKKKSFLVLIIVCVMAIILSAFGGCSLIGGEEGGSDGHVKQIIISAPALTLKEGQSERLNASVLPADATNKNVSWTTSNPDVATVTQDGLVTGVSEGTATVTVTAEDGGLTAECAVTVSKEIIFVTGVTLNKNSATLKIGQTETLTATVKPADATNKNVSWGTDNPSVATVSGGEVTAVSAGKAVITVTTEDGNKTAQCTVTVENNTPPTVAVTGVTLNKNSATLKVGQTETLTATVQPADASNKNITWSTSNPDAATVTQNGKVTAVSVGTATITVTTEDGNRTAQCAITVERRQYTVTFYSDGELVDTQYIYERDCALAPTGLTKEGYELKGWKEDLANGDFFGFDTPIEGDLTLYAVWEQTQTTDPVEPPAGEAEITYTYIGDECAAFEWTESNYSKAKVEYKKSSDTAYTAVDGELIRPIGGGKARVDIVGLKGNTAYDFKITTSENKTGVKARQTVSAHDRSGYAHFKNTDGVGAYNDDGTLKSDAIVVYVTETNKNTVTVNGVKGTGIVQILQNAKDINVPLVVRIIGTVGAATWNEIEYNADKKYNSNNKMPISEVKDKNGNALENKSWTQAELISGGHNTLNTSVYSELKGLDSKINYSKGEFDSCWNNCSISNVKNVTVEGIGEDARIFQWGFTWGNCNSIEIRNLTFEDYTEDACSFEGNQDKTVIEEFTSRYLWVHNNTFLEGRNYWDVCPEQDKHEGDGATDFKGTANVTISYNHYFENHKTGLVGSGEKSMSANLTFHHNWYEHCNSRLPMARQANMHMYNNLYDGSTGTNMSLRDNAYAFIENCYFLNANKPIVSEAKIAYGYAKVYNCEFEGKSLTTNEYIKKVTSRTESVANTNTFNQNFDTDSSAFYYKNGKSDVTEMLTAEQVKTVIPKVAGVQHRADGSSGGGTEDKVQSGTVVVIDQGTPKAVSGSLDGITITKSSSTTEKSAEYTCNGQKYKGSYKLNENACVTVKLAETKTVRLCFYEYNGKTPLKVSIGGVEYSPVGEVHEEQTKDGKASYFFVEVELVGGISYDIVRLYGVEISFCYLTVM